MSGSASIVGRADERALLEALVADVRASRSRALVIRGEPGIGKTVLLEHLLRASTGCTVARAVGVESEMELAYAGVHQLCAPFLHLTGRLPVPQRQALAVVFGAGSGPAPDRFLVSLAVLSLLAEAAEGGPVLCVVDDAQWLDQASALTLSFVARRLLAEPVGLVFAARPGDVLSDLPTLEVPPLRDDEARKLLAAAVPFSLDARVQDRLIAETHGNPLAVLELPRGRSAAELALGFGAPAAGGLSGRIEQSFARRIEALPHDARRLIVVAAAEPVGDAVVLWSAASRLGIASAAARDAEAGGVMTVGSRVRFRHPLARSAAYRAASDEDRRAAHRVLADVTSDADPDRRAWHRAAAATGPDDDVAAELVRSAERAQGRGGLAASAALLSRAVSLTGSRPRRAMRALTAADASLQAGAFDDARRLLLEAGVGPLDDLGQAQLDLLRGRTEFLASFGAGSSKLLLKAAIRLEPLDVELARDTYLDAWGAALLAGGLAADDGLADVCHAALRAPRPKGPPRAQDVLLDALATSIVDGRRAALALLEEATRRFVDEGTDEATSLRWGWMTVLPTYALWDLDATHAICTGQLEALRRAGALARLPLDLATFNVLAVRCGELDAAAAAVAEAATLSEATGVWFLSSSDVALAAYRGREAEARAAFAAATQEAESRGQGVADSLMAWLTVVLCNGLGRYREGAAAARGAPEDDSPTARFEERELRIGGVPAWAAPDFVEAAVRAGDAELVDLAMRRLDTATEGVPSQAARGLRARCQALLSGGAEARTLYEEAIDRLAGTRLRPDVARAHLLYGEWLLAEGERVEARGHLRTAFDQLADIGMEAFAARARTALLAAGETVAVAPRQAGDLLTPQERQIARLAGDGMTNREIGARLFLSPRTVEWHLHNAFSKLGIRSRRELPGVLVASSAASTGQRGT